MSATQFWGLSGDVTIASTAMHVQKWTGKFTIKVGNVSDVSSIWEKELPGGPQQFTGEFEAVYDDTIITPSSSLPTPFTNSQVSISLALGASSHTVSFTGQVYDLDFSNDREKPNTVKGTFRSSGAVTFA